MKEIKLTQGKVALVDDNMFEYLNQWKWYVDSKGYATRCVRLSKTKTKRFFMARVIMNEPEKMFVDHIDNNPLNNKKENS